MMSLFSACIWLPTAVRGALAGDPQSAGIYKKRMDVTYQRSSAFYDGVVSDLDTKGVVL